MAKKKDDTNFEQDSLSEMLNNDDKLQENQEQFMKYKSYAFIFEQDLSENINRTSIELAEAYPEVASPVAWQKFLNYPIVKKFRNAFLDEEQLKTANEQLKTGKASASSLKVKENIMSKNNEDDNSNIVVMFLPQKTYID